MKEMVRRYLPFLGLSRTEWLTHTKNASVSFFSFSHSPIDHAFPKSKAYYLLKQRIDAHSCLMQHTLYDTISNPTFTQAIQKLHTLE